MKAKKLCRGHGDMNANPYWPMNSKLKLAEKDSEGRRGFFCMRLC